MTPPGPTLASLAADLEAGRTTARELVEACLERIRAPGGEGARALITHAGETAVEASDAMDRLRRVGAAPGPYAGIPIVIKDLFDIAGQVTTAGSRALAGAPPAAADATVVARLRRAGFVLIGRSNMTEFAYSGLGLNPHHGTPLSVYDRATGRAPGGSTSGGAIAVADGMAHAALGTDTGGSCRIPAAFNGLVGWKPTARRIPATGLVPLSASLDSIGPIARSTACCASLDALLADEAAPELRPGSVAGIRLLAPTTVVLDDLDSEVANAFEISLARLTSLGARIERSALPELAELLGLTAKGGLTAAESYAWHRKLLDTRGSAYDPRVRSRIQGGADASAADYIDLVWRRRDLVRRTTAKLSDYDAMITPTVAIIPPRLIDLTDDAAYGATNLKALRNAMLVNLMDGCAISLPINEPGEPPVGLMLAAAGGADARLLSLAATVEAAIS